MISVHNIAGGRWVPAKVAQLRYAQDDWCPGFCCAYAVKVHGEAEVAELKGENQVHHWEHELSIVMGQIAVAEGRSQHPEHDTIETCAEAVLNTSFTTFAAFCATAIGSAGVLPIMTFGVYSAVCVAVNYFFVISLTPPMLVIEELRLRRYKRADRTKCCWPITFMGCCGCCSCCPGPTCAWVDAEPPAETPKTMTRVGSPRNAGALSRVHRSANDTSSSP